MIVNTAIELLIIFLQSNLSLNRIKAKTLDDTIILIFNKGNTTDPLLLNYDNTNSKNKSQSNQHPNPTFWQLIKM